MSDDTSADSSKVVWILLALLVIVFSLLVYFYKKLNRQTDDQYTIHRLVYGEGGARDWVRDRVRRLEVLSGRRLWLLSENGVADGQEGEGDEEGYVERGGEGGESHDDEQDGGEDDSSDDYSSLGGVDLREKGNLTDVRDERRVSGGRRQDDRKDDGEGKAGAEGGEESGRGLLVDLHPFSGSAIWSEDKSEGGQDSVDVTAL